jgi:hypothetical protein
MPADPVGSTMTAMRLASTLLEDVNRRTGAFPLADARVHLVREALAAAGRPEPAGVGLDAWGHPLWYRAYRTVHEVISYGADGTGDVDYITEGLYPGQYRPIVDASDPRSDLVLVDGRFIKRPFGDRAPEFATINAMNVIFTAALSYSVDWNRYPGNATSLAPVDGLASELTPLYIQDLPRLDGWGRPLMYASSGFNFWLVSFGADGRSDGFFPDGVCGLTWPNEGPASDDNGDAIMSCGRYVYWPRGVEP